MTSVLSSVAFLESFVNEIYSDTADSHHESPRVAALDARVRAMMREYWAATNQGLSGSVLSKYAMALLFAVRRNWTRGPNPTSRPRF